MLIHSLFPSIHQVAAFYYVLKFKAFKKTAYKVDTNIDDVPRNCRKHQLMRTQALIRLTGFDKVVSMSFYMDKP